MLTHDDDLGLARMKSELNPGETFLGSGRMHSGGIRIARERLALGMARARRWMRSGEQSAVGRRVPGNRPSG